MYVDVPEIHFSPQEELCHILEMSVNPVAESDVYGIDLYVRCKMKYLISSMIVLLTIDSQISLFVKLKQVVKFFLH